MAEGTMKRGMTGKTRDEEDKIVPLPCTCGYANEAAKQQQNAADMMKQSLPGAKQYRKQADVDRQITTMGPGWCERQKEERRRHFFHWAIAVL